MIFSTIFLLYDGERVWGFLLKGAPGRGPARPSMRPGGRRGRHLSDYVRGTLIVAAFHGIVILITLTILGVPLAFPLAVLVALGSFVPLVGAVVTGALAVGVAGLSQGVVAAVIVAAVLVLNNQIEAHALQPFVVGRYVRVHPAGRGPGPGHRGAAVRDLRGDRRGADRGVRQQRRPRRSAPGRPVEDQPGEGDPIPPGGG